MGKEKGEGESRREGRRVRREEHRAFRSPCPGAKYLSFFLSLSRVSGGGEEERRVGGGGYYGTPPPASPEGGQMPPSVTLPHRFV